MGILTIDARGERLAIRNLHRAMLYVLLVVILVQGAKPTSCTACSDNVSHITSG